MSGERRGGVSGRHFNNDNAQQQMEEDGRQKRIKERQKQAEATSYSKQIHRRADGRRVNVWTWRIDAGIDAKNRRWMSAMCSNGKESVLVLQDLRAAFLSAAIAW